MYKYYGSFELKSPKFLIADPYQMSSGIVIDSAYTGTYYCFADKKFYGDDYGKKISSVLIYHASLYEIESTVFRDQKKWENAKPIAVDSGMVGIYDHENWENMPINKELIYPAHYISTDWDSLNTQLVSCHSASSLPCGFVTESGKGDGNYPLFVFRFNAAVRGIRIDF